MTACDRCRDWIWDDLYGLLETGERIRLRQHLAACELCRDAQAKAVVQQQLLAEAARLDVVIPPFAAPDSAPATVPFRDRRRPGGPPPRLRLWPWVAGVAAALLFLAIPYGTYRISHERTLAEARSASERLAEVVTARDRLLEQSATDLARTASDIQNQQVRVQVFGPGTYQASSPNTYAISATDLGGRLVTTSLQGRVLDEHGKVVYETALSGSQKTWTLPAGLPISPGSQPTLQIAARDAGAGDLVSYRLSVQAPDYLTHLAVDKPMYRPGERVFARALTLERWSQKPAAGPMSASFQITNPQGNVVASSARSGIVNGVGTAALDLPESLPPGEYTIQIKEAQERFAPVARKLLVISRTRSTKRTVVSPTRPLAAGRLRVEVFPEGGDLVAGVANRVYFRARTAEGQPRDVEGQVIDGHQRLVAVATSVSGVGMGSFEFVPQAGENYRFQVKERSGTSALAMLPAARPSGLALQITDGVGAAGEAIHARLQLAAAGIQTFVFVLSCQGRIIGEEVRTLAPGSADVVLTPPAGCRGVLRLAVLASEQNELRPLAERLIYRAPRERLDVSLKANKPSPQPGDAITLDVHTTNERGSADAAWLLVSVVNEAAWNLVEDNGDRSLPAYFALAAALTHPAALEQAEFYLSNRPGATAALDLFLGTQGWRRFTNQTPSTVAANVSGAPQGGDSLIRLDSAAVAAKQLQTTLEQTLRSKQEWSLGRLEELRTEGRQTALEAEAAWSAFDRLQSWANRLLAGVRLAGAGLGLTGLLIVATNVTIGIYRRRPIARSAVAAGIGLMILGSVGASMTPAAGVSQADHEGINQMIDRLQKPAPAIELPNAQPAHGVPVAMAQLSTPRVSSPEPLVFRPGADLSGTNAAASGPNQAQLTTDTVPRPQPRRERKDSVDPRIRTMDSAREYAYLRQDEADIPRPSVETLVWLPALLAKDGKAQVRFDLPGEPGAYRIRVEAHSATGRLGSAEQWLDASSTK